MANGEYPLAGDGSMLVAHWPLKENCDDVSGNGHHGKNAGTGLVTFGSATRQTGAAELDGRGARIEVAGQSLLRIAAEAGLSSEERAFTVEEAKTAREAFVSSATSFVTPVVEIDDTIIADGSPGPLSRRLQGWYLDYCASLEKPA